MQNLNKIEEIFKDKIRVSKSNENKYLVSLPIYKADMGIYPIYLIVENDKCYLSDNGDTYTYISKIYDIDQKPVIDMFVRVIKHFGCRKNKADAFTIECTAEDIHEKYSSLVQCICIIRNAPLITG